MFDNFKKKIFIIIFAILLIAPMFSWGILILINESNPFIMETLDFDLNEKRRKATLSNIINWDTITTDIENYYNDRIPYRSILISTKRLIDSTMESPYKNKVERMLLKILSGDKAVDSVIDEDINTKNNERYSKFYMDYAVDLFFGHALADNEVDKYDLSINYPVKLSENGKVIIGQNDWLYLHETNIPYYTGGNRFATSSEIDKHIEPYLIFNDRCKKLGKTFTILICPEKEEIYPEYMPHMDIVDEKERSIYIKEYLDKYHDINYIYPKNELKNLKSNFLLYKKYDSHWNNAGAYVALCTLENSLGIDTIDIYDEILAKDEYVDADLAHYGNLSKETLSPSFEYKFLDYKKDRTSRKIEIKEEWASRAFMTECDKGADRNVFMIGDSFREGFEQFAEKDFKKFFCTSYLSVTEPFIKDYLKNADDIVIVLVERNEETVMEHILAELYKVLLELPVIGN